MQTKKATFPERKAARYTRADYTDIESIRAALSSIPTGDNAHRQRIAAALKSELGEAGRSLWDEWRAGRGDDEAKDVWRSIKPHRTNGITIKTLFYLAIQNGWKPSNDHKETDLSSLREQAQQEAAESERLQQSQWQQQKPRLVSLWDKAQPITGSDPAGRYLLNRGLSVPNDAMALRYIPELDYWNNGIRTTFPAMLAAVTSPESELVALHRTYLTHSGHKAPVPCPKKLTPPGGSLQGAAIRLSMPTLRNNRLSLGIAEGIETALAAEILSGVPVWSCISTSGLKSFVVPADVQNLYIFGDRDENEAGQKAALCLSKRVAGKVTVRIWIPERIGDWNDELLRNKRENVQ